MALQSQAFSTAPDPPAVRQADDRQRIEVCGNRRADRHNAALADYRASREAGEGDVRMKSTTLAELTAAADRFREERDWKQFHNPKDMALSMSLEVAELLEIMQWKNGAELKSHLAAQREH